METLTLCCGLLKPEEVLTMTKAILAACADCGTDIVLYEEQIILDFLGHLTGFLPSYDYLCPNCLVDWEE